MAVDTTPIDAPAGGRLRPDRAGLALLASGHLLVDMTNGALSPLLPVFKRALALSDLRTSLVLAAITFSSSFMQPVFGLVADRARATWLLWGGAAIATLGMGFAGLATAYWLLLLLIVVCGLGTGAYHPEAARVANHLAGSRKASGVAWFTTGGNVGFAIGPLLVALFAPVLDERTTLVFLVPGAIACSLLLVFHARIAHPVVVRQAAARAPGGSDVRGMALLVSAVSLRTWVMFGLMAIAPLYLTADRGLSTREQGFVIFAFVMTGALGTLAGSAVADRVGGKPMLVVSIPFAAPLIAAFILLEGLPGIVALAAAGFILMASFSATVVMGQAYMPRRLALAASWVLGFGAIGSATPWLPAIGAIADSAGRETALWVLAALPLLAAAVAALLPHPRPPVV